MKIIYKIILTIITIYYFSSCATYPFNRTKAIEMAKNYLSVKYNQKMKYLSTHSPFIDGHMHYVYFSPVDDNNISYFTVFVKYDLSDISDDYLLTRFEVYTKNYFHEKIKNIWGNNDIKIFINTNGRITSSRNYPISINENAEPKELEPYVNSYFIIIIMKYILNNKIIEEESLKIINALNIIKESNYEPYNIQIWYNNGKEVINYGKHQHITFYKTSGNNLPLWNIVYNKQELIEILNKYISKEDK